MRYVRLGRSGLQVSAICLGCMNFAEPDKGTHPWALGEEASRPVVRHALESGINFFDTGNSYSGGTSERIVGNALRDMARRDEIVVATKVFYPMRAGPNAVGLSRKTIMTEIDQSLRRLGTDYIDLYQVHRWDPLTPIEETLGALDDVIRAGKVRYIGASSMYAWQFAKALYVADKCGLTRFVSMQNHLNLLNREEEREMLPLCEEEKIGVLPWSPLARGRLAIDARQSTRRIERDAYGQRLYPVQTDAALTTIDRVGTVAERLGATRAQIALAWLLDKSSVVAPIIGAETTQQIDEAIGATRLSLTRDDVTFLNDKREPHPLLDESALMMERQSGDEPNFSSLLGNAAS